VCDNRILVQDGLDDAFTKRLAEIAPFDGMDESGIGRGRPKYGIDDTFGRRVIN